MNIKKKFGGVNQSIIVLLLLSFTCLSGISLAQKSQDGPDIGNGNPINVPHGSSTIFWLEAQPNDLPIPGDKLIATRPIPGPNMGSPEAPKGDVVISLFSGRGFALKGNETHVLRMNVELLKDIDPMYLRSLLSSNKSIEDIKEVLNAKEGNTSLRGSIRINESSYSLLNIKLESCKDNATIVDADLAKLYIKPASSGPMRPDVGDKIAVAGHIEVTIAPSEGGLVGKGELIMDSDGNKGKYIVLLHMERPLPYDILPHRGV